MLVALNVGAINQLIQLEQNLTRRITSYAESVRVYDISLMGTFLHEKYMEVSPRGDVESKEQILKSFDVPPAQKVVANKVDLSEWKFSFPAEKIVSVSYKQTYRFVRNEKEIKLILRVSATWMQHMDQWVMTQQHSAFLEPPKPSK